MFFEDLKSLPEFLRAKDLVKLGLYPTSNALYFARQRGKSPDFIKIGRRIIYPKSFVISFVSQKLQKGEIRKQHGGNNE